MYCSVLSCFLQSDNSIVISSRVRCSPTSTSKQVSSLKAFFQPKPKRFSSWATSTRLEAVPACGRATCSTGYSTMALSMKFSRKLLDFSSLTDRQTALKDLERMSASGTTRVLHSLRTRSPSPLALGAKEHLPRERHSVRQAPKAPR